VTLDARLYQDHADALRRHARRLAHDPAEAEDLVTGSLEVFGDSGARFQGRASLATYLKGICTHIAQHARRAAARRHAAHARLAAEPAGASPDTPEALVARREMLERVDQALGELPDEQREAFLLASVQELDCAEVAARQGVPEATVRSRLFLARRKLREALEDRPGHRPLRTLAVATTLLVLALATVAGASSARFTLVRAFIEKVLVHVPGMSPDRPRPAPSSRPAIPARVEAIPVTVVPPAPSAPVAEARSARMVAPVATATTRVAWPSTDTDRALYERAHRLHFHGDQPAAALAAWDAYLGHAPRGRFALEARYNRAIALARLGRRDEAVQALAPFAAGVHGTYRQRDAAQLLLALAPAVRAEH
jgi:RNA polymerase sigma-70 factor (ECF subfamily)